MALSLLIYNYIFGIWFLPVYRLIYMLGIYRKNSRNQYKSCYVDAKLFYGTWFFYNPLQSTILYLFINYLLPLTCKYNFRFVAFYISDNFKGDQRLGNEYCEGWSFLINVMTDKCTHVIWHILVHFTRSYHMILYPWKIEYIRSY